MQKILVSWSTAYDYIMNFAWEFKGSINQENLSNLSVWFLVHKLKKEVWWTGLNIIFNLALLWEEAILLSSVGDDYIFDWFLREKINLDYVYKSDKLLSASAYIINDENWNQITAFYPWAMDDADKVSVYDVRKEISYTIVSPNKKEAMLKHLRESKELWYKTFFDPWQQIGAFSTEELEESFLNANFLICNEYEFDEILSKTWKSEIELLSHLDKIIVTLWEKWSKIIDRNKVIHIPACPVSEVLDPTWAWDAFRAWLLKGLIYEYDWETSAKIGSIIATNCVQFHGAQNHFINKHTVELEMKEVYWIDVNLCR